MVQAIETRYQGYRFRSRLEARWAVFFDAMGVPWQYEQEGYQFQNGSRYLPDFWLPQYVSWKLHHTQGVWFEVKPGDPSGLELEKAKQLVIESEHMVFIGQDIPRLVDDSATKRPNVCWQPRLWGVEPFTSGEATAEADYDWVVCPACGTPSILEDHTTPFTACGCVHTRNWREYEGVDPTIHPRLLAAYDAARSARFEFGESGRSW